jgi:hypothetical protein
LVLDIGESNNEFSTVAEFLDNATKNFGSFGNVFVPSTLSSVERICEDADDESSDPLSDSIERAPTTAFSTEGESAVGFVIEEERVESMVSFKAPVLNPGLVGIDDNAAPAAAATSSGSGFLDKKLMNALETPSSVRTGAVPRVVMTVVLISQEAP